jgi:hypothetical protein
MREQRIHRDGAPHSGRIVVPAEWLDDSDAIRDEVEPKILSLDVSKDEGFGVEGLAGGPDHPKRLVSAQVIQDHRAKHPV